MNEKSVSRSKLKWVCVIALLIIAIFSELWSFCGRRVKPLPDKLWTEIQAAWQDEHKVKIPWDGERGYYGIYQEDVVVWIERGVTQATVKRKVAGEVFWWSSGFVIRAYHDGEFLCLEEAYEEGWLTQKDIVTLAKIHREQVSRHFFDARDGEMDRKTPEVQ